MNILKTTDQCISYSLRIRETSKDLPAYLKMVQADCERFHSRNDIQAYFKVNHIDVTPLSKPEKLLEQTDILSFISDMGLYLECSIYNKPELFSSPYVTISSGDGLDKTFLDDVGTLQMAPQYFLKALEYIEARVLVPHVRNFEEILLSPEFTVYKMEYQTAAFLGHLDKYDRPKERNENFSYLIDFLNRLTEKSMLNLNIDNMPKIAYGYKL